MKKLSLIIFISAILIAIGSSVAAFKLYHKFKAEQRDKESVLTLTSNLQKEIGYYKTKTGQLVANVEQVTVSNGTLNKLVEEGYYPALAEIKKLKNNFRNVEHVINTTTTVTDTLFIDAGEHADSCDFKYEDKWSRFERIDTSFNYSISVPQTLVIHWERKWFLGKKKYNAQSTSSNPNVLISEFESIKVVRD